MQTESIAPHRRIAVLVERRYLTHDQPSGLCVALRRSGHEVRLVCAEDAFEAADGDWFGTVDAVVARGTSSELLSLLRIAEDRGALTINSAAGIAGVQNKARLAARLEEGGIPVFAPARGRKVGLGRRTRSARRVSLVAAGQRVWVPGRSGHSTEPGAGHSRPAGPAEGLRELAHRCGHLLRLRLFGIECVQSANGLEVSDVVDFPDYTTIPHAGDVLAEEIIGSLDHPG